MPPKTQPGSNFFREVGSESPQKWIEKELAKRTEHFEALVKYLEAHRDEPEEKGAWRFTFPLPPNMNNSTFSRAHHRHKTALLNQYKGFCEALWGLRLLPPVPRTPLPCPLMSVHLVLRGESDVEGRTARPKWPVDWLKGRGWIVDDNDRHLRWAGIPTQQVCYKTPQRIEITLREGEEA